MQGTGYGLDDHAQLHSLPAWRIAGSYMARGVGNERGSGLNIVSALI